jgi:hypothetical protein
MMSSILTVSSVTTTNRYATIDLEMKRKAIEQAHAIDHTTDDRAALWRTDASILAWLDAYESQFPPARARQSQP